MNDNNDNQDPETYNVAGADPETKAKVRHMQANLTRSQTLKDGANDVTLPPEERAIYREALAKINVVRQQQGAPALGDFDGQLDAEITRQALKASVVDGEHFAFSHPPMPEAVWGAGADVLWSEGEPLWIVGPTGSGKTTFALWLALARAGITKSELLGYPVTPSTKPVLYLAADRPRQIGRNLRRMVTEDDREALKAGLMVHQGPLGWSFGKEPRRLAEWTFDLGAGCVVLDSLKDLQPALSDEEAGHAVSAALAFVIQAGVEVLVLHHTKKKTKEGPPSASLDAAYGSTWFTAGAGSVLVLGGRYPMLKVHHQKTPADEVGPLTVVVGDDGSLSVSNEADLLDIVRSGNGLTAREAAQQLYETDSPDRAAIAKVRRKLGSYEEAGLVHRVIDSSRAGDHYYGTTPKN